MRRHIASALGCRYPVLRILLLAALFAAPFPQALHNANVTNAQTAPTPTLAAVRMSAKYAGANTIELSWTAVPGAAGYWLWTQIVGDTAWEQIDGGNLQATSYTHRGLTPGVTYKYALHAVDGNGQQLGPWSNLPTATVPESGASSPTPAPDYTPTPTAAHTPTHTPTPTESQTAPTPTPTLAAVRMSATYVGANTIELSWTAVPGAARYWLWTQIVGDTAWEQIDGGNLQATSYTHRGLTPGVTYKYALHAVDGNDKQWGPWSNLPTATVPESGAFTPAPTPTPTPTQTAGQTETAPTPTLAEVRMSARYAGANTIELSWTPVPGAARYLLWTQIVGDTTWEKIDGGNLQATSYTHRGLTPGVTYKYALHAVDGNDKQWGPWSNLPTATVPESGASTPAAVRMSARYAGANTIELSWTPVPGAARYLLWTQIVGDTAWQPIDGGNLQATSYTHRGLTPGVTYKYALHAVDGNGKQLGPWSNLPTATVPESGATPYAYAYRDRAHVRVGERYTDQPL